MKKIFIGAQDLLRDSFLLARQVYLSDFRPDFIIGVWRGGTPVGIAIQEYFDYAGVATDHIAIRTSSYTGIDQKDRSVQVLGLDYIVDNIKASNHVLLVDDVFDTGRSIEAILSGLRRKAHRNFPATIRVACPWFKPRRNQTRLEPDYYINTTEDWLVFPHELKGLSSDEIKQAKGAEIFASLPQHAD